MNVSEGMRRLGLVAGSLGALTGAFLSYIQFQPLFAQRTQHAAFQALVSSPAVQKRIETLNELGPWSRFSPSDRLVSAEVNQGGIKAIYFVDVPRGARIVDENEPVFIKGSGSSAQSAHYSVTDVRAIETGDGATVTRIDAPASSSYLLPSMFPILGFLLPWGAIKTLTWIGTGFADPGKRGVA